MGIMKPFKPPSMVNRPAKAASDAPSLPLSQPPPTKKRRLSPENEEERVQTNIAAANVLKKPHVAPSQKFQPPAYRKPLAAVDSNGSSQPNPDAEKPPESYFTVLWRKFTTKKNKTWDGDGVLSVKDKAVVLQDISGRELGRGVCKGPLLVGSELSVGGKDVEVEAMISKEDYVPGRVFLGNVKSAPKPSLKEINEASRVTAKEQAKYKKLALTQKDRLYNPVASTQATSATFKAPLLHNTVQTSIKNSKVPVARHDPTAPDALVMKRPRSAPKGKQIVDVVVDPLLTRHLRPHQREGVAFMYECIMGLKEYDGEGAILADEMGLGKTLQTISLLWTLLKQNPIADSAPVIKKALIVCPVSLIKNWRQEFRKWLGNERIGVFVADNNKIRLTDFTKGRAYSVMIIGYEKLTKVQNDLQGDSGIDIVICDEGHRLKTATNKAAAAIKSLSTERRIILSGTPVQNDLSEFFTMVDFVNPSIMSKYSTFKREFETPIIKSRQPGASSKDLEKGEARSAELAELTSKFILRRTADILAKYLPQKTEYVVFCRPTDAQRTIYRQIIESQAFLAAMNTPTVVLELINVLRKVCNSPTLLLDNGKGEEIKRKELIEHLPRKMLSTPGASGKLQVLDELLFKIKSQTEEKVVVVSNYTSTMDVLATMLTSLDMKYLRLDGSTPQKQRQDLVDRFNRSPQSNSFVFLLSAKAGGTGINLIGASRLIMFDNDWNPTTDLQAMARIHRDGQKRPCFIYRFLTQGALDEKIFQRQVSKTGLADSIVDGKSAASGFTQAELRDLFTLDESEECQTHSILGCRCPGNGLPVTEEEVEEASAKDLDKDGIEVLELDHSDDEIYRANNDFVTLSKYSGDSSDAESKAKDNRDSLGRAKMLSLMQYTHFDTSLAKAKHSRKRHWDDDDEEGGVEDEVVDAAESNMIDIAIEDAALKAVITDGGGRVGFVLTKIGKTSSADEIADDDE